MSKTEKYTKDIDKWESGELGQDENHVKKVDISLEGELDSALGLQMISIRLQKQLIDDLKFIAQANGIGYQPLMRDVLSRFARSEIKNIMRDVAERKRLEDEPELKDTPPKSKGQSKKAA